MAHAALEKAALRIESRMQEEILSHLFQRDMDEHGLVILAGMAEREGTLHLFARDVVKAKDGVDYVKGSRSHRMLRAEFIQPLIRRCREERLVYLAVHNHGGEGAVAFSDTDLRSHELGYPALLELTRGMPVGALVYAKGAVAGEIWLPNHRRLPVEKTTVVGVNIVNLYEGPRSQPESGFLGEKYDRQIRMFGDAGQRLLRDATVGVIGVGGVGSLVVEQLARMGVGRLIIADLDNIETSNLSRVVGATEWDARETALTKRLPVSIQKLLGRTAATKCSIAERVAHKANPRIKVDTIVDDFAKLAVARRFLGCDFLVLAADSMRARLVFNAMVHQYLIPGFQIGSKLVSAEGGAGGPFSVVRWLVPGSNCLWCSGMISSHELAVEGKTKEELKDQAYGSDSAAPSVITLNAMGAAQACNDLLFSLMGLNAVENLNHNRRFQHFRRRVVDEEVWIDAECPECSGQPGSRFAKGDALPLPTYG